MRNGGGSAGAVIWNLCVCCGRHRSHRPQTQYDRLRRGLCASCYKLAKAILRLQRRCERMTGRSLDSLLGSVVPR